MIGDTCHIDIENQVFYNVVSVNGNANNSEESMPNRITMEDVAREAGVSIMTVSRVVNDRRDVSLTTRRQVLEVIERLGYRPSGIARGLVTKHTRTLGLVVPDISNPFFASLVRGAEQEAYAEEYSVFLGNTDEDPQRELAIIRSLDEKRVDGLLLCSSRLSESELAAVAARFSAMVLVSRQIEQDCVGTALIDDELGGRLVTEHLLNSGHRKIGVISGPQISLSTRGRLQGYRNALHAAGIPYNPDWVRHCSPVVSGGAQAARELLTSHPELTAFFCHNDLVAVGALQACSEAGLRVPDDFAIVGYDDIPLASLVTPTLTTCAVPRHELGARAMRLLLDQIKDCPDRQVKVIVKPELVVRASSPLAPVRQPLRSVS